MRLYILELSRYAIAAVLAVYTLLSYQMLFHQKDESVQKINGVLQVLLILAFQGIGSLTVAAGLRDTRYLILGALEMLFIAGAIILFHTIYDHANMLLYHNVCMLMSIGFVICLSPATDRCVSRRFCINGSYSLLSIESQYLIFTLRRTLEKNVNAS